jgi:hypothetical protein
VNENLRQEYLHRMGIQCYFPRQQIPGAATSLLLAMQTKIPAKVPMKYPPAENQDSMPLVGLAAARLSVNSSYISSVSASLEVQSAESLKQDVSEIRFQLGFIRVSDDLLALISLPYVQDTGMLNSSQKRLFINLCRALKLSPDVLDFNIKAFRWPFSEAAYLDKSEAAARAALNTYLSQMHEDASFSHLLLLGSNIAALLEDFRQQIDGQFLVCRSLDEMLKMHQLKRETWTTLRASGRYF